MARHQRGQLEPQGGQSPSPGVGGSPLPGFSFMPASEAFGGSSQPQNTPWNTSEESQRIPCHDGAHTTQHRCWIQKAEGRKHILSRKVYLELENALEWYLPAEGMERTKRERKMNKREKTRKMQTFQEKLNKDHSACRGSIKTQEDERQERFNLRI